MFNQISPELQFAIYKGREKELESKIAQRLAHEARQEAQATKEAYSAYVATALKEKDAFLAAKKIARGENPCSGLPC